MKKTIIVVGILWLATLGFSSCEKANLGDENQPVVSDGVKVKFCIDKFEQTPFDQVLNASRSDVGIDQICGTINFAVFSGADKVKSINQKKGDNNFGTFDADLAKGTYQVVVLAHNCSGNATITSPDKITFPDNKVTDTFYYYAEITVDDAKTYSLEMKRAVAMFRLMAQDSKPDNVKSMKFFYTGGSSTFNAVTGYGCVNSRQTEIRTIADSLNGKATQYDVYTFPHEETDKLKVTVTALDGLGTSVCEKVFEEVPVQRNMITKYSGTFFGQSESGSSSKFTFTADNAWSETSYNY